MKRVEGFEVKSFCPEKEREREREREGGEKKFNKSRAVKQDQL